MQIVIDIPEEVVNAIQNGRDYRYDIHTAIAQGISLPKGHGRLIDADKLTESILCRTFGLRSVDIDNAPTIIEVDRTESEDEE